MDTINVKDITFSHFVDYCVKDWLSHFSYDFTFGKSYLLNAELGKGAWALSSIIGGLLKQKYGEITKNNMPYEQKQRQKDAWFVRRSEFMGFRAGHRTVKNHVQHGLKKSQNQYLKSEDEIISRFRLTLPRYNRPIRQLSGEGWSASCAIGLAHGKTIFCFPYVEYVRPYFIRDYHNSWLKEHIDLLRDSGAIVLIPAMVTEYSEKLCDEIVQVAQR